MGAATCPAFPCPDTHTAVDPSREGCSRRSGPERRCHPARYSACLDLGCDLHGLAPSVCWCLCPRGKSGGRRAAVAPLCDACHRPGGVCTVPSSTITMISGEDANLPARTPQGRYADAAGVASPPDGIHHSRCAQGGGVAKTQDGTHHTQSPRGSRPSAQGRRPPAGGPRRGVRARRTPGTAGAGASQ